MESVNTPILRQILLKLDGIDTRLTNVETRLTNVETRLTNVETNLFSFYKKYTIYVQNEAQIQENVSLELCYTILNNHNYRPQKHSLRIIYNINGNILTDFDGCLVINLPVENPNRTVRNSHLIRKNIYSPESIIIEAKHSLTKEKIDKKMNQMLEIKTLLTQLPTMNMNRTSSKFKSMVNDNSLRSFPINSILLFASDDIPSEIRDYIIKIYDGMTEEYYNHITLRELRKLKKYENLRGDTNIPKKIKTIFLKSNSHIELFTMLENEPSLEPYKYILRQYCTPFISMIPVFDLMKQNIGFVQFNTMYMPRLISTVDSYSF